VGFGVGCAENDGLGIAGVAVGAEGDGVAIGVVTAIDDAGVKDGPAPPVQPARIRVSATVDGMRRIEVGIGCPPNGSLP
jgi:hypothetical protein